MLLVLLVDAKNRITGNLAISLRFQESIKKVSLFRHPEWSYRKHDPERKGWYQHLTKVQFIEVIPVRFGQALSFWKYSGQGYWHWQRDGSGKASFASRYEHTSHRSQLRVELVCAESSSRYNRSGVWAIRYIYHWWSELLESLYNHPAFTLHSFCSPIWWSSILTVPFCPVFPMTRQ